MLGATYLCDFAPTLAKCEALDLIARVAAQPEVQRDNVQQKPNRPQLLMFINHQNPKIHVARLCLDL
jgi:hypothetical protein